MRNPMIARTTSSNENHYRQTDPKQIKKIYKTTTGIPSYLSPKNGIQHTKKTRKNIQHPITLQTPKMEIYKLNQKKVLRIMIMIAESYKRLEIKINS